MVIRWKEKLAFDPSKVTLLPITGSKFEDEVFCPLVLLTFCHCYREGGNGMEWNGILMRVKTALVFIGGQVKH